MTHRTLLNDLDVLGIPAPSWAECLADSRSLSYCEWSGKWVARAPHGVSDAA